MWLLLSFGTRSAPASSRRGKSELIRRGLLIQANKLVICAYGDPLRLETRSCSIGKVWPRMGVRGMGNRDHWRDRIRDSARQPIEPTAIPNIPALARKGFRISSGNFAMFAAIRRA